MSFLQKSEINNRRKNGANGSDRKLPSLAFRAGVLGGLAVLLFAVLIFRIWFLQVISGDDYIAMADNNRVRIIREEAPRGLIYDRNMQPLVENRAGLAVTVFPAAMVNPEAELAALSQAIGTPVEEIKQQLALHQEDTYRSVVVKKDITPEQKSFLIERIPLYFPGVDIKKFPLRSYPEENTAAHVLGHVGQIDEDELMDPRYSDYSPGDEIGKDGVEYQFDRYLRGTDGSREVEVDADGRPKRELQNIQSQPGNNVVLTIDTRMQKATEEALAGGIDLAHDSGYLSANGGAAVVMNPNDGQIYAIASYPSFDPDLWVGGISDADYENLNREGANDPLLNRAIAGQYPPASTFKVVTATAALEEDVVSPLTDFTCGGVWDVLSQPFKCWGAHGSVDMRTAIIQSCDIYFYNVGYRFYKADSLGIQRWASMYGMGRETGVDLPGEAVGRVPDPEWKRSFGQTEIDQMWLPGDSVNLSIGQGDILVTPLQLATTYAAIANNGRVVTPHVGLRVEDQVTGVELANLQPEEFTQLDVSLDTLQVIKDGLVGATGPGATVGDTFVGFTPQIAGKTGTAQVAGKTDYAWYVAYAPADDPQVVVAVLIEQGGGGGKVAAPVTRSILEAYFNIMQPAAPPPPEG